ncbi:MAG: hypothetical protein J6L58_00610 [Clostridia bacterium]|nr:hypothetical protein [Clostridia bacterium]
MYCIKCGVGLEATEKKCPLCNTEVCHPDFMQPSAEPLYPSGRLPKSGSGKMAFNGAVIILFFIPLLICFFADISISGRLEWFGYVAGALAVAYVSFALPLWFKNPNPVIFVPCSFASAALYLMYINLATQGDWFLSFALPVTAVICLITSTVVTLLHYLRRGRLYILGGAFMALGTAMLLIEFLIGLTFKIGFIGWSVYPLVVLALFGGLLIFLALNPTAREILERKLFF